MGIFSSISQAIFGKPAEPRGQAHAAATPEAAGAATGAAVAAAAGAGQAPWWLQPAPQAQQGQTVTETDVTALLETRAASHGETLNWRTSIVDLMKLLGIDSSLDNRKALARELGYSGDTSDSATMNIWLHRQVMRELAANGGRVPAELTD